MQTPTLTVKERLVLEWMVAGFPPIVISRKIGRNHSTVKGIARRICNKLGAENRVQAVEYAIHRKLVEEPICPFYGS